MEFVWISLALVVGGGLGFGFRGSISKELKATEQRIISAVTGGAQKAATDVETIAKKL